MWRIKMNPAKTQCFFAENLQPNNSVKLTLHNHKAYRLPWTKAKQKTLTIS